MRVDFTLRAPDDGEIVWLLAINADGDVTPEAITSREALLSGIGLLEGALARVEEEGHHSADEAERWDHLLHALRELERAQ